MAMENRRQTLLQEMGIQSWFSRTALPGAGRPHAIDWDAGRGQGVAATQSASAKATPEPPASGDQVPVLLRAALVSDPAPGLAAPVAGRPQAPVDEPPPVGRPSTTDQPSATAQLSAKAETPALEFAFSWFNVDKHLSVLAMLPSGADRLNSTCRQMLQRILLALIPGLQDSDRQEHTFHWPFAGDLGLPTGQQAARQAVDGFVARRLREQPSAMLLILSDEMPPFLCSDADERQGQLSVHRQFGFAMLRTHSLHAMEADSELKRSAWQAMQALRERLSRGAG